MRILQRTALWGLLLTAGCSTKLLTTPSPILIPNEVIIVDGETMTLTDFIQIKTLFPKKAKQDIIRMGTSALVLKSNARHKHKSLSKSQAFDLVLFSESLLSQDLAYPSLTSYYGVQLPKAEQVKNEIQQLLLTTHPIQNPLASRLQ